MSINWGRQHPVNEEEPRLQPCQMEVQIKIAFERYLKNLLFML